MMRRKRKANIKHLFNFRNVFNFLISSQNHSCEFLSSQTGGSALNTSKILSLLGESDLIFCGGIGNDVNGTVVREHLDKIGLKAW